jgi:hypothetical protein
VKITRRNALKALAAASFLPMFRSAIVHADEPPRKRFVVWFTSCGTSEFNFRPTGGETDFVLGPILAPLERHRDKLLIFGPNERNAVDWSNIRIRRGLSMYRDGTGGAGHNTKMVLTGRKPIIENNTTIPGGISVDQYLAQKLGGLDYLPSLQLGVACAFPELIYAGARQPLPVETNPVHAFDRVFAGVATDDPVAARRLARRRRVVDLAYQQSQSLVGKVSNADKRRMQAQVDALDAAARRLDATSAAQPPVLASHDPAYYHETNWDNYDKVPLISGAQTDIMAAALGAGLTHIGSLQYGWAAANARSPFVGVEDYLHSLSHDRVHFGGAGVLTTIVPEVDAKVVAVNAWYMEELARFADKLAAIPESDGKTVLDHTTILVVNELAEGAFHTVENMPFFLLGDCGGALRTGRYLTFDDRPHNDLLVSVINAMGLPDTTFGDPAYCNGPLPGLT